MRWLFLTLIMLFAVASGYTQSSMIATQKQVVERLKKQVAEGEKEVASLRKGKVAKQQHLRTLANQINNRNRLLKAQNGEVELLKTQLSTNTKRHNELSEELSREQILYAEMVREAYRNYRNNNLMSYLFTSENFVDVARKIVNLRALSQIREERIARIESLASEVEAHNQMLSADKESLDRAVKELEKQKGKLVSDQRVARNSVASMSAKEKRLLREQQLQKQKLDAAVNELRKLSKGNTTGASFTAKTSNLNLPVVGGRVKRYMDNMAEVVGSENANVISIYEGKVVDITQNRITGKYDAYIAHGEYITSYAGLESVAVVKGAKVVKNQKIGVIGQSVDIITMQSEYKIVFGIYPPNPAQKMRASDCFKK